MIEQNFFYKVFFSIFNIRLPYLMIELVVGRRFIFLYMTLGRKVSPFFPIKKCVFFVQWSFRKWELWCDFKIVYHQTYFFVSKSKSDDRKIYCHTRKLQISFFQTFSRKKHVLPLFLPTFISRFNLSLLKTELKQ